MSSHVHPSVRLCLPGLGRSLPALSDIHPHESPASGQDPSAHPTPFPRITGDAAARPRPSTAIRVHLSIRPSIGLCPPSPYMHSVTSTHTSPQRCPTPSEMLRAGTLLSIHIRPCPAIHPSICPSARLQLVPTCPRCHRWARTGVAHPGLWALPGSQPAGAGCSRGRGWQR